MMRYDSLRRRIKSLERKNPVADGILVFPDGSTRAIRLADPLAVMCDAMALSSWAGPGVCEGDSVPIRTAWQLGPRPVSKHDSTIALLARATAVKSENRFLHTVQSMAAHAVEMERNRGNVHAPTQQGGN
jgi:hypothetical protein